MNVARRRACISLGSLCLVVTLGSCSTSTVGTVDKKHDSAVVDSSVVRSLQRQIREREKRIAELESQMDALKVIDQDMEKLRMPSRPPVTLTPLE